MLSMTLVLLRGGVRTGAGSRELRLRCRAGAKARSCLAENAGREELTKSVRHPYKRNGPVRTVPQNPRLVMS